MTGKTGHTSHNHTLLLVYVNTGMGLGRRGVIPLGLQQVAAVAQQAGWTVTTRYYGTELSVAKFRQDMAAVNPAILGFQVDLLNIYAISRLLRRLPPEERPFTILGGPQATADYQEVLQQCPAEIVVRGDGEPVLSRLLAGDWLDPDHLKSIPGISFRLNGRIHHNPEQPWSDPDDYPLPAWDTTPPLKPFRLHLLTARGCPHHCAFCAEATVPYRPRRIALVVEELRQICQARQPDWMVVVDDTFTAQADRARKLCQVFQDHYGGPWSAEVTAGEICRHPSLAREMAAAGLQRVQLGIESMHDQTLHLLGKKISAAQIEDAIEILLAAGVNTVAGNFIVGLPGETASMVRKNRDKAVALIQKYPGQVEISASVLTYNPGAPFFKDPKRYRLRYSVTSKMGAIDLHTPACGTDCLSRESIARLYEEFLQALSQALDETLPATSPELRRKHLRFQELGLDTPYARKLAAHHYIAKFYQYVYLEGSHQDVMDIPVHELPHAIPQRTRMEVQLGFDGNVILTGLSQQTVALNTTASFLDEMACGQHTITEIAQMLYQRLPAHRRPHFDTVLQDAMDFYVNLGRDMHIAFVIP